MKTLFRVLTEEESKHAVRWRGPEFADSDNVANNAASNASCSTKTSSPKIIPILGSALLKQDAGATVPRALTLDLAAPGNIKEHNSEIWGAAAPAEKIVQTASADMLQTSYDEGYAKGLADISEAMQHEKTEALSKLLNSIAEEHQTAGNSDLEQEVIGLSLDIAKIVINQELSVQPNIIAQLVKAGLQQLHDQKTSSCCVFLHPTDASIVRQNTSMPIDVAIEDDSTLERGCCRIETGSSVLRVGVDDWLQSVALQLGLTGFASDVQLAPTTSNIPDDTL